MNFIFLGARMKSIVILVAAIVISSSFALGADKRVSVKSRNGQCTVSVGGIVSPINFTKNSSDQANDALDRS